MEDSKLEQSILLGCIKSTNKIQERHHNKRSGNKILLLNNEPPSPNPNPKLLTLPPNPPEPEPEPPPPPNSPQSLPKPA